jgi:hypothetical protein
MNDVLLTLGLAVAAPAAIAMAVSLAALRWLPDPARRYAAAAGFAAAYIAGSLLVQPWGDLAPFPLAALPGAWWGGAGAGRSIERTARA